MKILFVYKEDYPWDVRVEKIVTTLAETGHEVTLLARNSGRRPVHENTGSWRIRRLPALPVWCGRLNTVYGLPLFFNPVWLAALRRALDEASAEVIVVRDLPLMLGALWVARARSCRVVFDMAECYPEMYRSILSFNANRLWNLLTKNPWLTDRIERIAVTGADHVLVMIEESRDRLLRMGVAADKISIVSNTPPLQDLPPREHTAKGPLRLLYVGFVTRIRGLDNVLRGLQIYLGQPGPTAAVEFHVVGIGEALPEYSKLAADLGIAEHVRFHGWCEQEFVDALYAASDVGVLTYRICSHWNHTIPNKIFDYMRSSMPVLATEVRPIQRIIEQEDCGLIVPDGDAAACAQAIRQLTDPEFRAKLGDRGRTAVLSRYNWQQDAARLISIIESLAR